MSRNTRIAMIVLVVFVVIGALALYWYGTIRRTTSAPAQPLTVVQINSQAGKDNPDFASAVQLEAQGQYQAAIPHLESALSSATDPVQRVAILSHLAQDDEVSGAYGDEIQTLQELSSNSSYSSVTRAYAVEQLALLYVHYPGATATAQIFSQEPYKDLYVSTSTNLTARHLFSYATTIDPLPVSEYYIALSYANTIFNKNLSGQTSSVKQAQFAGAIQNLIAAVHAGDAAMTVISSNPPTAVYLLSAQLARADALGQLQLLGNTDLGDAEQAFQSAIAAYDSQDPSIDGAPRLQYAYFLARAYGSSRAADIQTLLAPVCQDPQHGGPTVEPALKSYIGVQGSRNKSVIVLTASLDPQFKTFLISLGWTSADFATTTAVAN